jgi:hypothetical protein
VRVLSIYLKDSVTKLLYILFHINSSNFVKTIRDIYIYIYNAYILSSGVMLLTCKSQFFEATAIYSTFPSAVKTSPVHLKV